MQVNTSLCGTDPRIELLGQYVCPEIQYICYLPFQMCHQIAQGLVVGWGKLEKAVMNCL